MGLTSSAGFRPGLSGQRLQPPLLSPGLGLLESARLARAGVTGAGLGTKVVLRGVGRRRLVAASGPVEEVASSQLVSLKTNTLCETELFLFPIENGLTMSASLLACSPPAIRSLSSSSSSPTLTKMELLVELRGRRAPTRKCGSSPPGPVGASGRGKGSYSSGSGSGPSSPPEEEEICPSSRS